MPLCTLVVLVWLTSDVIYCSSCISSLPGCWHHPALYNLILTTYAARCAFLPYFRLWALHAFLPEISLLVAFILNYIHMLDIASWIKTVAKVELPRIKITRICQEMVLPWLMILSKISRQLSSPVWLTEQIPFTASLLVHSIKYNFPGYYDHTTLKPFAVRFQSYFLIPLWWRKLRETFKVPEPVRHKITICLA